MDEHKVVLVLLQAKVSIEKVFPLISNPFFLLLVEERASSLADLFGIKNVREQLTAFTVNIVVKLELSHS